MLFESETVVIKLNDLEANDSTAAAAELRKRIPANSTIVVVAANNVVQWLPAISLALQSKMVRINHYLVIDELPETFNSSWPDAPITYFGKTADDLNLARLRGWGYVDASNTSESEVIAAICDAI
jgi:hypothetical protein